MATIQTMDIVEILRSKAISGLSHEHAAADAIVALRAEVERLTGCLTQANAQAERFERQWYLRGDELDRLRALIKRARPYVQAYAAITRTDEVSLDASETAEAMRLSGPTDGSR